MHLKSAIDSKTLYWQKPCNPKSKIQHGQDLRTDYEKPSVWTIFGGAKRPQKSSNCVSPDGMRLRLFPIVSEIGKEESACFNLSFLNNSS